MSGTIETGMTDFSLNKSTTTVALTAGKQRAIINGKTRTHPSEWVFVFQSKCIYFRRLSEKYGLDWENDMFGAVLTVTQWVQNAANVHFNIRAGTYRGAPDQFVTFLEDLRRSLHRLKVSDEQMDK
ncbi:uncharacterized protein FOMMEDRAFT_32477, partial [Fomitiporia mediterranea MF3/22]